MRRGSKAAPPFSLLHFDRRDHDAVIIKAISIDFGSAFFGLTPGAERGPSMRGAISGGICK